MFFSKLHFYFGVKFKRSAKLLKVDDESFTGNLAINQPKEFTCLAIPQSLTFAAMTQEQIKEMRDRVAVLRRFL
jgi:hypothetical protein